MLDFFDSGLSNNLYIARITGFFIFLFFAYKNALQNQLNLSLAAVTLHLAALSIWGENMKRTDLESPFPKSKSHFDHSIEVAFTLFNRQKPYFMRVMNCRKLL
jgi:hypothetical protein